VAGLFHRLGWSVAIASLCACANPFDAEPQPDLAKPASALPASPLASVTPAPAPAPAPSPDPAASPEATRLAEIRPELTPSASLSPVPSTASAADAAGEVIERGRATWYGPKFHGKRTASGERFDMHALTAAHKTLPFGTMVRVRSLRNGREVVVRINDRGPFAKGRVIDLSQAAMKALGLRARGVVRVELLRE
jgi:rare lipoprotein A